MRRTKAGEVAEWSNVPDSKSGVRESVPWVQIPPSPPKYESPASKNAGLFLFGSKKMLQ